MVNRQFLLIFIFITIAFSFFAYQPIDVVIAGPQMTDLEKFELELKNIEDSTGIKIKYETHSDIETYLIKNNSDVDIAIIPNPQGVTNLGERGIVLSIDRIISEETMERSEVKILSGLRRIGAGGYLSTFQLTRLFQ